MARKSGSDELYRLIHALTAEEKGYFKKFAKRHTSKGSNYLQLFEAISKQNTFIEKELKLKFKHYPVMKVYLYDMLTDAMVLYSRKSHQHIDVLNHIQKIHFLFMKGLVPEAVKAMDKIVAESRSMELFNIERYLLRLKFEITATQLNSAQRAKEVAELYSNVMKENMALEQDLTDWELLHIEWLIKLKQGDHHIIKPQNLPFEDIKAMPALSVRSKLRQLFIEQYMLFIKPGRSLPDLLDNSARYVQLSQAFRANHDATFADVGMQYVYATNFMNAGRYVDAMEQADKMLKAEQTLRIYYPLAFVRGCIVKLNSLMFLGRMKEALQMISASDNDVQKFCKQFVNETDLRHYYFVKLCILFVAEKYQECWIAINDVNFRKLIEGSEWLYADMLMLQMMVQCNMGNVDVMQRLARKVTTELKKRNVSDHSYSQLLNLFKHADKQNIKDLAKKAHNNILKEDEKHGSPPRLLFSKISYAEWLSTLYTKHTLLDGFLQKIERKVE